MPLNRSTMFSRGAVLAGMLALAACDEAPTVHTGYSRGPIVNSTINFVQSKGPLLVQVHGNPFGRPSEDFAVTVMKDIAGAIQSPLIRFTRNPAEAGIKNITYRIVFGYPENQDYEELCTDKVPTLHRSDSRITVAGVLCQNNDRLAEVAGSFMMVKPDHPMYKMLLVLLTQTLLDNSENN